MVSIWQIIKISGKPLYLDQLKTRTMVTLVEDKKTESNHKKIAEIFNKYFANLVTSLEIAKFENIDQL